MKRINRKKKPAGLKPRPKKKSSITNPVERDQPPLVDLALYNVPEPKRTPPAWIMERPTANVGAWEPLFHRRRLGGDYVSSDETFAYEHSEEFVRDLKNMGVTILISSFSKNYYRDEDEMVLKKKLVKLLHRYGLRMAVYIRADNFYEEIFPKGPEGKGGYAVRADGRVPSYGMQEWRKNVCFHHAGVMEKFKETVHRAVVDIGVDACLFDGFEFGGTEGTDACRCDACARDFRDFLRRRYGKNPGLCKERFGFACIDNIKAPGTIFEPSIPPGAITRPDWQEWISFRCTWSVMLARKISEYIYQLNPEVAIIANNMPQVKENMAMLAGQDPSTFLTCIDILHTEDAFYGHITGEGIISHRARQTKMAYSLGKYLNNYLVQGPPNDRGLWRNMASTAAFNRGRVGHLGWTPYLYSDFHAGFEIKKRFLVWQQKHWNIYRDLEIVGDYTVWRSQLGLAWGDYLAYAAFVSMEQLLVEQRMPFEIRFDECLERLGPNTVLIAPDVACMTVSQGKKIMDFVRKGGGLLIGRNTSLFDGWYRRRHVPLLNPIMSGRERSSRQSAMKHITMAGAVEMTEAGSLGTDIQFFESGKGRVVYVPEFVDAEKIAPIITPQGKFDTSLDYSNWRIPERADEIVTALKWLRCGRHTFTVDAPRGVIAEFYRQRTTGKYFVHLVNVDFDLIPQNIVIRMQTKKNESIKSVKLLSPDDSPAKIELRKEPSGARVALSEMRTYSIVAISI